MAKAEDTIVVKPRETSEKFMAEFNNDNLTRKKDVVKNEDYALQSSEPLKQYPRSHVVSIEGEGVFKMSLRRHKNIDIAEFIKESWKNVIEKSTANILKKFDALGFQLEKLTSTTSAEFNLMFSKEEVQPVEDEAIAS